MYIPPNIPPKKSIAPIIFAQIVVILVSIAAGYLIFSKVNKPAAAPAPSGTPVVVTPPAPIENPDGAQPQTYIIQKNVIAWHAPVEIPAKDFPILAIADVAQANVYKVAIITGGAYDGAELFNVLLPQDGPGDRPFDRFMKYKDAYILLARYSANSSIGEYTNSFYKVKMFSLDRGLTIAQLEMPDIIRGPVEGQDVKLVTQNNSEFSKTFAPGTLEKQFESLAGVVYQVKKSVKSSSFGTELRGTFIIAKPDDTYALFVYQPSIMNDPYRAVATVYWNDIKLQNIDTYTTIDPGGCGMGSFISLVDVKSVSKELVVTGLAGDGKPAYEFADPNNPLLTELYKIYTTQSQASYDKSIKLLTRAQFLKSHPLFIWQDPFGRFIKFQKADFQTAAECGKPVIYLYPEKTTRVNVQLKLDGGMSKSEPAYGTGWNVVAQSNGALINDADNKPYPYLFWEGRGGAYASPTQGWVVKQRDVHSFLVEKLAMYGLNKQESVDFIEFWEPLMQGSPYYFVGFHTTNAMNQIAPLTITPRPNTMIRVLMDFKPLQQPIKVEVPIVRTPQRTGFTVLEWGGVLTGTQKIK